MVNSEQTLLDLDAARQAVEYYRSINAPEDEILAIVGKEAYMKIGPPKKNEKVKVDEDVPPIQILEKSYGWQTGLKEEKIYYDEEGNRKHISA